MGQSSGGESCLKLGAGSDVSVGPLHHRLVPLAQFLGVESRTDHMDEWKEKTGGG